MLKNIINIGFALLLLSSCATGENTDYLKKSASGKYFDRDGFQKSKRAPLYNSKYISQAKRNIQADDFYDDEDFDEDDPDEIENEMHSARYKNMNAYREMVRKDTINKMKKRGRYPNLYEQQKQLPTSYNNYKQLELKDEIDEIKYMLEETKKELENSKCPSARAIEKPVSYKTLTTSHVKTL